MYYGMICRDGPVCLVKVTGNLNAMGYEDILFDNLVPFLEQHGHSDYIYQQDNAPIHSKYNSGHCHLIIAVYV